jgi:hypothetical protein
MAELNFLGFVPVEYLDKAGITYDSALPQMWVNDMYEKIGHLLPEDENIARHFVTVYPNCQPSSAFGGILPIDMVGALMLRDYSVA